MYRLSLVILALLVMSPMALGTSGPKLFLVAVSNRPLPVLIQVAASCKATRHLDVTVLPTLHPGPELENPQRHQAASEDLIPFIVKAEPAAVGDRTGAVIGVTDTDIYVKAIPDWAWAFGHVDGNVGIISVAHMDDANYGRPANATLLETRLRKMVYRQIGYIIYHQQSNSPNPKSVMHGPIGGLQDLDALGEDP